MVLHITNVISDHCNDPLVLGVYNSISDAYIKHMFKLFITHLCYAMQLFSYALCLCIMWPEMGTF